MHDPPGGRLMGYTEETPTFVPRPSGHPGIPVGLFSRRIVCAECGTIALYDNDAVAWLGPDGDTGMDGRRHLYIYDPGWDERRVNDDEPVERPETDGAPPVDPIATREPVAAERPGDDRPARPYRDPDTGDAIADPVAYGKELARADQRARRRAMRERLGIPVNASTARSERRSSPEYRRIEKRRERARKAGADPDIMGPDYQLPARPLTLIERGLQRSAERAGILRKGDLRR